MIKYSVKDRTGLVKLAAGKGILNKKLMKNLGDGVRATTIKETTAGRDYRGRKFKGYSTKRIYVPRNHKPRPKGGRRKRLDGKGTMKSVAYDGGYREYRKAHGRSATKPDLIFTGKMLGAFQIVKLTDTKVRLGFVSKAEQAKALGNITGKRGNLPGKRNPRVFVGVGPKHEKAIQAELASELEALGKVPDIRRVEFK